VPGGYDPSRVDRVVLECARVAPHDSPPRAFALTRGIRLHWIPAVFLLGTAARVLGQLMLGAYQHTQVFEYEEVATSLLAGHGYMYFDPDGGIYVASQSSPLYIVITALVYLVTDHSQPAMLVLQALAGGVTCVLAAWVAARFVSTTAGVIAGVLVALDPALVVFAAQLHSLTFDALSNVALVAATVGMPHRPKRGWLFGLGALFGVCALMRATALALLPIHVLWLKRYRGVPILLGGVLIACVAVVVYSPWPIRNTVLLGQLTFGSSESTEWLWRGNNPNANGASLTADGQRMIEVAPADFRAQIQQASEAERANLYRAAAVSWITTHPLSALRLYGEKLGGFWWGSDASGILYPSLWLLGYRVWFLLILVPGALAAWCGVRNPSQRPTTLLILLTLLAISAVQAVFYVEGRHRIAVEPLLLILSGAGLAFAADWWRGRAPGRSPGRRRAGS